MSGAVNKGDFIKLDYTAKMVSSGQVFDTTDKSLANSIGANPEMEYGPITICVGERHVVIGLDDDIISKPLNKKQTITLSAEKAFGKKDPKKIQLIQTNQFTKQQIKPVPGLQVNIDDHTGIIKTVSGGRTVVDFNHPLSGQEITYEYTIVEVVNNSKEQINTLLEMELRVKTAKVEVDKEKKQAIIQIEKLPKELHQILGDRITKLVPAIKEVKFK
ncbi:peptidylprolyl isomerase [Candidatus Woesearchaeota archaeon]|nr:peptidylprolyl isomerase [Candidatus Woesearchaeota archaeon]